MTTVLLCDDEMLVRTGLRTILSAQPDIEILGEAVDGRDALEQTARPATRRRADGHANAELDGIETTRRIHAGPPPHPAVVMLTTFDADDYVHEALTAGACGFLLKSAPPDELVRAVRKAAERELLLAPEITRLLVSHYLERRSQPSPVHGFSLLTDREREVLELIAQRPIERRHRGRAVPQRGDRQDPHQQDLHEARRARPRPSRRRRLRIGTHPSRCQLNDGGLAGGVDGDVSERGRRRHAGGCPAGARRS